MDARRRTPLGLFFEQCRLNFQATGAVLPSSRALARAITAHISPGDAPRRILEAGPGTGVFTEEIARRMGPFDHLDLYEINPVFADFLEARLLEDPSFSAIEGRVVLHRRSAADLPADVVYDRIVSGLPLNNFEPQDVKAILGTFMSRLAPGGVLSYFEYVLIRTLKQVVASQRERLRLRGVGEVTGEYISRFETGCEPVLLNLPPAVARHLLKPVSHAVTNAAAAHTFRPAPVVQ